MPRPGAAQDSKPLTVRTLDPVAQPGDEVVVQVVIGSEGDPVGEVLGTGFELSFDEGVLSFKDRQVGSLFASNHPGNTLEVGPRVGSGTVDYSTTLFDVSSPPADVSGGEVVRLRFTVKSGAQKGTYSFSLSNAQRSTSSEAGINIKSGDLSDDDVEVAEDRRGERMKVSQNVQDGQAEVDFRDSGLLTIDFASLDAAADLTVVRDGNPIGGTALPDIGGVSGEKATNSFWELSQTGASSFQADVCFGLSDLAVATPDESTLKIFKRAGSSDSWSEVSSELRPTTGPTKICATGLTGFSQFAVAAPQGHGRTIVGTDGTGNDTGWRLLGLPAGAARSTLEEDLSFDVDAGHLLHRWKGGGPNAWSAVTSGSTEIQRGAGLILYFFDDSVDPLTSSGIALDLPATGEDQGADVPVSGLSSSDRFHLLGNPYEEAFDLSSLVDGNGTTFSSAGFQATVMVWDPSGSSGSGSWTTITEGTSSDNVAAWQGFFIERKSTGSGATSLTFLSAGKQGGPGDLTGSKVQEGSAQGDETPSTVVELGLTVTSGADTLAGDRAKVLFIEGADAGWDAYEASQLPPPNSSSYAVLSSPILRNGELVQRLQASRAYPTTDTMTVPLSVRSVQISGAARLGWPEEKRGAVPDDWAVELEDTESGERADLRAENYSFDLAAGDGGNLSEPGDARFRLHVVPSSAIPVELADFEAYLEDGEVRLTWQTASETNNAGFAVQRREGEGERGRGDSWTDVGFVEGSGTTSEARRYRFTDADLPYGADSLAYRLRQVDTDGTAHFSEAVSVGRDAPERLLLQSPFPNPTDHRAALRFAVPEATEVQIGVYDLLGRRVATVLEGRQDAGRHEERLDVGSWAGGMYFLRLEAGGKVRTRKLTVMH